MSSIDEKQNNCDSCGHLKSLHHSEELGKSCYEAGCKCTIKYTLDENHQWKSNYKSVT